MFTRFKVLTLFLIFCLSFTLITIFWGTNGYFAKKALLHEQEQVERIRLEKESELDTLRRRNESGSTTEVYGKDLVYRFGDTAVYEPEKVIATSPEEFHGLSTGRVLLVSLLPTGLYLVGLILLWLKGGKKVEPEVKEERSYESYND